MSTKTIRSLSELRKFLDIREILQLFYEGQAVFSRKLCCPLHEDIHPSFFIYNTKTDGQRFKCFSLQCGAQGDVFDLIRLIQKYGSNLEVLEFIEKHSTELLHGIHLDLVSLNKSLEIEAEIISFWRNFQAISKQALLTDPAAEKARTWLIERGIHPVVIPQLPIGFFQYEWISNQPGMDKETLLAHGIKWDKNISGASQGCICFFYYTSFDTISRVKMRPVQEPASKALIFGRELGEEIGFFGLNLLKDEHLKHLILVEGEFDVCVVQSQAFLAYNEPANVVCKSGGAAADPTTFDSLTKLGVTKLVLFPDNDKSGLEFITHVAKLHIQDSLIVSVCTPEDYQSKEDPADYAKRTGTFEQLSKNLVSCEKLLPEWLANKAAKTYTALTDPTPEDYEKFKREAVQIAADCNLRGLTLDDYLSQIIVEFPKLTKDLFRYEIAQKKRTKVPFMEFAGETLVEKDGKVFVRKFAKKTEEISFEEVCNFTIDYEQIILFEDGSPPRIDGFLNINEDRVSLHLTASDLKDFETLSTKLRPVACGKTRFNPYYNKWAEAIFNTFNSGVPSILGISTVGLQGTGEFIYPSFLVKNGEIKTNDSYFIALEQNIILRYYDIELVRDMPSLIESRDLILNKLLKTYRNPIVPLAMLGHIMSSFLVPQFKLKPGGLYLEGLFESGKTTTCQLMMNLFANYPVREGNVSAACTINYVEKAFNNMSGVPVFWDDIKKDTIGKNRDQFIRVINTYHDRQGRGRLNRFSELMDMPFIRGNLIMCGENLPAEEGSVMSRCILLRILREEYNEEVVEELIPQAYKLSVLTPHFIAWTQRQHLVLQSVISEKTRTSTFINLMGTGLYYFLKFLVEEVSLPEETFKHHWEEFTTRCQELKEVNAERVLNERDDIHFMHILEQLIHSGCVSIADSFSLVTSNVVGFVQDGLVFVYPQLAIAAVQRFTEKRFNTSSLTSALRIGGYLDTSDNHEGISSKRQGDRRQILWKVRKEKLFENLGEPGRSNLLNLPPPEIRSEKRMLPDTSMPG